MLDKDDQQFIESLFDKKLKPLKRDIKKIRNDLEMVIGEFDKRIIRVEKHLDLPPLV